MTRPRPRWASFGPEWNPVLAVLAVLALLVVLAALRWWLGAAGVFAFVVAAWIALVE